MFLNYEYIGKIEENGIKLELYDTGKKAWSFKRVYAYQLFDNNRLVIECDSLVMGYFVSWMKSLRQEINSYLQSSELPQLEYIPCFEPVEV
jgi:hypothetical protein